MLDLSKLLLQKENQYFERKSLWHGPPGRKKPRERREVRDQIAEVVTAFANADGGTLVLGVENDGTVTGHSYPSDVIDEFLAVPSNRLNPKLPQGRRQQHGGQEIVIFEVESAPKAVMVVGDGFPYRVDDKVILMREEDINAIKQKGIIESYEARLAPSVTLADLDENQVKRAAENAGLGSLSSVDYLLRRRLADRRGDALVLRQAAVLLFARLPEDIDNPNAAARIFQIKGTERRSGAKGSPSELPRIEGNLPTVIEEAKRVLTGLIRKSAKLHDLFFRETPEYPEFAWQEALVNAVAHRDYGQQGRAVEVWLYEDRMEVVNPGGLLPTISLDEILARRGVHASRNPRVTRVLTELGYMREQGEGIPRMFEEMEESWLPLPVIQSSVGGFTVKLLNTPILEAGDPDWQDFVRRLNINTRQKRILVGRAKIPFTSANYQEFNRIDRDLAYREIQELVQAGLVEPLGSGRGMKYKVLHPTLKVAEGKALREVMSNKGKITNADCQSIFTIRRASAAALLARLAKAGVLEKRGSGRGAHYVPGQEYTQLEIKISSLPGRKKKTFRRTSRKRRK